MRARAGLATGRFQRLFLNSFPNMITPGEAHRIALEQIASWGIEMEGDSLLLLDSDTIEREWGWVCFYTSRLWYETNDDRYLIAGNAPFIVERRSGRVVVLGTGRELDHYLDRYERYGDPHFEPGSRIRLAGCVGEPDRLAATRLVRSCSGVGLQMARQIVEDCIIGHSPCVTTPDAAVAEQLAQDLESMGFVVERLPRGAD